MDIVNEDELKIIDQPIINNKHETDKDIYYHLLNGKVVIHDKKK